ncbi:SOS response-associated peptidase [Rhodospirillum rubrum]|uniref:Abasic site processing protein n=1 Tax=Rhodospirillum rubrum (strain ATCC 11170 / ATH 1.1.1 / DSM 467 / LMG 4362 / NCIMB 8255 / S1) TaxID=269796 RepID=Q2RMY8_RHORT|nr:SOS response-associated peptidase [Rhodospirillum rubrum]ABC24507.1 Protein of unknown function DUF159 [Rhodospirillum rubrum ATCC 11170]AEO50259.1 hypothetical protein F11_18995 [Rhodospirillum rubrum F11]MBK5956233.1 DUF159 family protein [Rhodospirillum rubrum]QXG80424.1 SOS response-associated peptidase [Rhodospirillum rubrum]HAP99722.1 SOS response-associated peptidase [Rhodospirillum rubrum]
MCGRFACVTAPEALQRLFETTTDRRTFPPRWNIAPSQDIAVVRFNPENGQRALDLLRWGLIPHWAKDPGIAAKLINARAETLLEKPSFRQAFQRRRCLIPADHFYEWAPGAKPRQPYLIKPSAGGLFSFAGLWENWRAADGTWLRTVTIITTTANAAMAAVHDRMPVIIPPGFWPLWLGEAPAAPADLAALLQPPPAEAITLVAVGPAVNSVAREGPEVAVALA